MRDCIFCKIVAKKIPAELIREAAEFIVIKDIQPKAPVHLLIIPKKHIPSMNEVTEADRQLLGQMLEEAKRLAVDYGLSGRGYKVVINCGREGGQMVPHVHFHFLGGQMVPGLF